MRETQKQFYKAPQNLSVLCKYLENAKYSQEESSGNEWDEAEWQVLGEENEWESSELQLFFVVLTCGALLPISAFLDIFFPSKKTPSILNWWVE